MKKTLLLPIILAFTLILSQQLFAQANSNATQQKIKCYASVNGLKIYYEVYGEDKLLLHMFH
jgi:hypothetical protein